MFPLKTDAIYKLKQKGKGTQRHLQLSLSAFLTKSLQKQIEFRLSKMVSQTGSVAILLYPESLF